MDTRIIHETYTSSHENCGRWQTPRVLETEFLETEIATAFDSWLKLFSPIIEITSATYRALDVVVDAVDERKDWSPLMPRSGSMHR
jgi:hypothetical protein